MSHLRDGQKMEPLTMLTPLSLPPPTSTHRLCAPARRVSAVLVGLCVGLYLSTAIVRVNVEPSVPVGLWQLHAVPAVLERGMVVLYPPPAASWPWHPWYIPFLKPVAGVAGDMACIVEGELWVRGVWYGRVVQEAAGRAVPHLEGCLTVAEGEVFVASLGARSFDSRYYGPVPVRAITHTATPVWVRR